MDAAKISIRFKIKALMMVGTVLLLGGEHWVDFGEDRPAME